ncbi:MAG: hypothetical protein IPK39_09970 [Sulfuritalea sp.]|nr:hypothetical protein [Sulfuritalea sp.]
MEFDWTTVILEMLNFLVLIWLLKRFFYRPVQAVIEKRRAASEKILTDADARHREADALKGDYEQRLAQFAKERELAMAKLDEEIATERSAGSPPWSLKRPPIASAAGCSKRGKPANARRRWHMRPWRSPAASPAVFWNTWPAPKWKQDWWIWRWPNCKRQARRNWLTCARLCVIPRRASRSSPLSRSTPRDVPASRQCWASWPGASLQRSFRRTRRSSPGFA